MIIETRFVKDADLTTVFEAAAALVADARATATVGGPRTDGIDEDPDVLDEDFGGQLI